MVLAPCGYHLDGAADGIVVRPGPRLVTGVEALAALLHPGAAAPASPGTIQRIA